jgi:hypothetical protein
MKKKRDVAEETARAAMAAFEPLVRLFIDLGMSSPEAETLLRAVFVHETERLLSERAGQEKVTHSAVALHAGVHRNVVSEILSVGGGPKINYSREDWSQRAGRVLREWHFDQAYLTKDGKPRVLELRSENPSDATFWTLCASYAPSIWPTIILEELLRVNAVRKHPEGSVQVLKSTYGGENVRIAAIQEMGARARDLLSTLVHNLQAPHDGQRVVETMENVSVDADFAKVLRRMFRQRAQALTASVESELNSDIARGSRRAEGKKLRMGMTVFAFESPEPQSVKKPAKTTTRGSTQTRARKKKSEAK